MVDLKEQLLSSIPKGARINIYHPGSVFRIRIRIQKAIEYGSNTDSDLKHFLQNFPYLELAAQ